MEECPFCHKPLEDTDNFCRSCGANLMLPEFERAFCPRCGARVLTGQWYCRQCQCPLEEGLEKTDQEGAFATPPTARAGTLEASDQVDYRWTAGSWVGYPSGVGVVLQGDTSGPVFRSPNEQVNGNTKRGPRAVRPDSSGIPFTFTQISACQPPRGEFSRKSAPAVGRGA